MHLPPALTRAVCRLGIAAWLGALPGCEPRAERVPAKRGAGSAFGIAAAQAAERAAPPALVATRATPAPQTSAPLRFAGGGPVQDFVLEQIVRAKPLSFKSVSSGGAVMRMRLAGPVDAAFKPVTSVRPLGPNAEVAAYRLARCLALDSVPPAASREVPAATIREALDPESKQSWQQLRERMGVADEDMVRGAAIYWIPELANVGLERRAGLRRMSEWLRAGGELPHASRTLAASVSTMMAFDYVIGNFDRWSGGNVQGNAAATLVYVRDHDLAFPARMNEKLHRRLWHDLQRAERFSARFYAALKQLTPACFERELARDPGAASGELLTKRQFAGVFDRREALLSHIESLIALRGESSVLVFE